uniref:sperm motility kinase 2B-like n=1 Tax=Jaculus jaculus TaxID=51337 RepID=UPI001E1B5C95|nr:sperm motility kinase 2B-like [Jaculus jaculus]
MSLTEETLWSQYEDLGVIGTGAYSSVRKARHRSTGVTVAIKVLEKRRRIRAVLQEVEIMKMLAHPNTVSLFQIVDTKDNVYLVLEFCQNELLEHISMKGCLQEDEARQMFRQIIDAIFYCHSLGIVHQDIKPDNIMVDDGGKVTVIDFGLASRFWPGQMLRKFCGTYKYMPPEAISFEAYDGPKKDMWSLGVLLYYMVTGTIPFNSDVRGKLCLKIITGDYKLPEGLSAELKDLIRQLLTVDPKRRPTTQIRTHPWLQQGQGGSDNPKPLPRELDRNIISAMGFMKFNEDNILKAIQKNKYDEIMATYLILQSQKQDTMRQKAEDKPVWPGSTPFPSTSEPAAFPMPPKRKHPEPGFRTLSLALSASEQPEDRQRAEHEEFSSASLPDLYTSRPEKRTTAKPRPERARPYTAAASLCPGPGPQLPQKAGPVTKDRRPKAPQHTISPKAKEPDGQHRGRGH